MAGGLLRIGHMAMRGTVPTGQEFLMSPPRLWVVADSQATVDGVDLAPTGPLREQERLADFWLPQRGVFYCGSLRAEAYDTSRHRMVANRADVRE